MSLPMHSSAGSGASRRPGSAYWNHAFTLAELRAATGGWAQANVVGSGSFGTVYRATLDDWSVVAVRHKNLVRLLGSCVDDGERLLVLEFFPEGSLGARLHYASQGKVAFLSWAERMAVIEGVCRGLTYMHHDIHPPLIHRDIKAANILLRGGTKGACIADFGLARLMQDDESGGDTSSAVKGTLPYMAPEYMQGGYRCLSPKCDVYSFGVVVLELVTGRPVTARFERGGRDIPLVELAASLVREQKALEMIDPAVWDAFDVSEAECCIQIALQCLQRDPSHRPTMEQVGIRLRTRGAEPRGSEVGSESPHDVLSGLTRGDPGRSMAGWDTGSSSGFSSGAYRFLTAR
ncbi:Leucine-rich repeat protein kinase family protein [Klebsormidium nitens]|uniref:Leucine-rich repeat protein kinase family protein n=1 Tax=Klebsormidium nitens TaxID=105231 RepID=A0A1Y1HHZ4_KLENI|nr:Leucine-rich repeat protein kinase family protein [Klebsormidium nitens]|eukprot:GAQ78075.1 Leucine-rich repeat protein kinase family protein [Klebsormidium nitens]